MRTAQDLPVQETSGVNIGGVAGSSHDLLGTVRANRTGVDNVVLAGAENEVGRIVHDGSPPQAFGAAIMGSPWRTNADACHVFFTAHGLLRSSQPTLAATLARASLAPRASQGCQLVRNNRTPFSMELSTVSAFPIWPGTWPAAPMCAMHRSTTVNTSGCVGCPVYLMVWARSEGATKNTSI